MPEFLSNFPTWVRLEAAAALVLVVLLTIYEYRRQTGCRGKGVMPLLFRLFTLQVGLLVFFFIVRQLFVFVTT